MKKNANIFETLSTIISMVYKLTFIIGTVAGFILWIVWWRDYKKFLNQNKEEKIDNNSEPLNPEWVRDEKYDLLRYGVGFEDDRELY